MRDQSHMPPSIAADSLIGSMLFEQKGFFLSITRNRSDISSESLANRFRPLPLSRPLFNFKALQTHSRNDYSVYEFKVYVERPQVNYPIESLGAFREYACRTRQSAWLAIQAPFDERKWAVSKDAVIGLSVRALNNKVALGMINSPIINR